MRNALSRCVQADTLRREGFVLSSACNVGRICGAGRGNAGPRSRAGGTPASRPSRADGLAVVGKDLLPLPRHALQDRPGLVGQMTPDVVADLLPRVFHVADQHGASLFVDVRPADAGDLVLASRAEKRESHDLQHVGRRRAGGAECLRSGTAACPAHPAQAVGRVPRFSGSPRASSASCGRRPSRAGRSPYPHAGLATDSTAPGGPDHCPPSARARARHRRPFATGGIPDQCLTRDFEVGRRTDPGFADGLQRGPLRFAERADPFDLIEVPGNDIPEHGTAAARPFYRARLGKLGLSPLRPCLRRLLSGEGLALLINL